MPRHLKDVSIIIEKFSDFQKLDETSSRVSSLRDKLKLGELEAILGSDNFSKMCRKLGQNF